MEKITVRAKMKVNSVIKSGNEKSPNVNVVLGAVYSNDPESENRSFATATPSASINLNIDAGRPAAEVFALGQEFYVDLIPLDIPKRWYIGDHYPIEDCEVILQNRDASISVSAKFTKETNPRYSVMFEHNGESITKSFNASYLTEMGYTHWTYPD